MRLRVLKLCALLCGLTLLSVDCLQPLAADERFDWPGIRGPRWDGISTESGIMDAWPEQGPPVLWTRELGQGYSAFIAWGDRIATQYQSLSGQYLICMDGNTGKTLWEYRYDWPYDPAGVYPGPRATPTYPFWQVVATALAFAAFFWSSVVYLHLRVR